GESKATEASSPIAVTGRPAGRDQAGMQPVGGGGVAMRTDDVHPFLSIPLQRLRRRWLNRNHFIAVEEAGLVCTGAKQKLRTGRQIVTGIELQPCKQYAPDGGGLRTGHAGQPGGADIALLQASPGHLKVGCTAKAFRAITKPNDVIAI